MNNNQKRDYVFLLFVFSDSTFYVDRSTLSNVRRAVGDHKSGKYKETSGKMHLLETGKFDVYYLAELESDGRYSRFVQLAFIRHFLNEGWEYVKTDSALYKRAINKKDTLVEDSFVRMSLKGFDFSESKKAYDDVLVRSRDLRNKKTYVIELNQDQIDNIKKIADEAGSTEAGVINHLISTGEYIPPGDDISELKMEFYEAMDYWVKILEAPLTSKILYRHHIVYMHQQLKKIKRILNELEDTVLDYIREADERFEHKIEKIINEGNKKTE